MKWHFRDPKLKNFPLEHAPAPRPRSVLERLWRSNFSSRAYNFKISRKIYYTEIFISNGSFKLLQPAKFFHVLKHTTTNLPVQLAGSLE